MGDDPDSGPVRLRPEPEGNLPMTEPVVDLLADEWRAIDELCSDFSDADWEQPTDCPGWAVRDQLSHVIGTERMLLGEAAPALAPGDHPHVRNPIGEVNEAWVDVRRGRPGSEVLEEFREVTARRLEALRAMSPEDFDREGPTPVGEAPYREFMNVRVFDCWIHEQDMRRAVVRRGHLEGPIARHSVGRVTRAMPMVVGKRAAAPEGATVVLDVTGPAGNVVPVVVEGRARVLDDAPENSTVTVRMDAETYCCLGGGRLSASDAIADGRVSITGDDALGRRIVEAMNIMI